MASIAHIRRRPDPRRSVLFVGLALSLLAPVLMTTSCGQERPPKYVLANPNRVPKSVLLQGSFLYLKSVTDVKSPGAAHKHWAPGRHLESDKIIKFVPVDKDWIDVVATTPLFDPRNATPQNQTLARFRARYVDIKWKQTADGQDTREQEETEARNPWDQREFVVIDWTDDSVEPLRKQAKSTSLVKAAEIDEPRGALNLAVQHYLDDETLLTVRYSFLREPSAPAYIQRPYPTSDQLLFGVFKTTIDGYDGYHRITREARREVMNRLDVSQPFTLYFSPDFPVHLEQAVREVIDDCNQVFVQTIGKPLLQVEKNSGQELGDLRFSMIVYEDSSAGDHGILAYGPSFTHPVTGQILRGYVVLHASSLRRAQFTDSLLDSSWRPGAKPPALKWLDPLFDEAVDDAVPVDPPASAIAPGTLGDPALRESIDRKFGYNSALARVRAAYALEHRRRITRFDEMAALRVEKLKASGAASAAQLERAMFKPVFAHELLHILGLKHNFSASADEKHLGPHGEPPSVLDYPFVFSETLDSIGPYDRAALTFLYSADPQIQQKQRAEKFLYCSDEHVFDSRFPLCQQYDAGTDLYGFVENQIQRYAMSFYVNNLRHDEVHFALSEAQYAERVQSLLIPIRQAYDNAQAIILAHHAHSAAQLWSVLGPRIEYDGPLPPDDPHDPKYRKALRELPPEVEQIQIGTGSVPIFRYVDHRRAPALYEDARRAKKLAFAALARIVREPRRREYPIPDLVAGEAQSRGVLVDKMLALKLLAARTPNPVLDGSSFTMYSTVEGDRASNLFVELLSNTVRLGKGASAQYTLHPFNPNLRTLALDLITQELAQPGVSAEARLILSLEKVSLDPAARRVDALNLVSLHLLSALTPPRFAEDFLKRHSELDLLMPLAPGRLPEKLLGATAETIRARATEQISKRISNLPPEFIDWENTDWCRKLIQLQHRNLYLAFTQGRLNPSLTKQLEAAIVQAERSRNQWNSAYTEAGGGMFYKAQVRLPDRLLETATGHLIRDNINRTEDKLQAVEQLTSDAFSSVGSEKPDGGSGEEMVGDLRTTLQLARTSEVLRAQLANEKLFLQEIYRRYQKGFNGTPPAPDGEESEEAF